MDRVVGQRESSFLKEHPRSLRPRSTAPSRLRGEYFFEECFFKLVIEERSLDVPRQVGEGEKSYLKMFLREAFSLLTNQAFHTLRWQKAKRVM